MILLLEGMACDSTYIRVHFLYGSKPARKYRNAEPRWFGGLLGGHVGIETRTGRILNFIPQGRFHWFTHGTKRHSTYAVHSPAEFYAIFGGHPDSVKFTTITIPISGAQKTRLDSISREYLEVTPYDYAFFGMRCSAAASDILGHLAILPAYSRARTWRKTFYPRKLRKRLLRIAEENSWMVIRRPGTIRRKWEAD